MVTGSDRSKSHREKSLWGKPTLRTRLCDLLEIEYPIVLAGMGSTSGPTLAAAVSNAGGLGVIGGSMIPPATLREWIQKCRRLTAKPFGVDLLLPESIPTIRDQREIDWPSQVPPEARYFAESFRLRHGIPKPCRGGRNWVGINAEFIHAQMAVILEQRVPVFAAGLGNPDWVVPLARDRGMKVLAVVGNVKNALRAAQAGVDLVAAQGSEGGGHTGRVGTLPLVPQVVDAVAPLPVLAAGGIADGRGLAAALALGADGVWAGSAFLASPEAFVDHVEFGRYSAESVRLYRQKFLDADEESTVVTKVFTGKTCRIGKNRLVEEWAKANGPLLPMPLQGILTNDIVAGAEESASTEFFPQIFGQACGLVKEAKPAAKVVEDMVAQAAAVLSSQLRARVRL